MTYSDGSADVGNWENGMFKGKGPFGQLGKATGETADKDRKRVAEWKWSLS